MINSNFRRFRRSAPPPESVPEIYNHFRRQTHLLIGGCTGSGKSVCVNGLICSGLLAKPNTAHFVLIDPKRVELSQYKHLPQVWQYCQIPEDIEKALSLCVNEMDYRYQLTEKHGLRKYPGCENLYIIIDEYADLKLTGNKNIETYIQRIAQLGRAAKIHLICATQRTTRDIVDGKIKVNIDSRVCLRVPSKQDSRNVIELSGAEQLPKYGQCLYMSPDLIGIQKYYVPMIPEEQINNIINYYL